MRRWEVRGRCADFGDVIGRYVHVLEASLVLSVSKDLGPYFSQPAPSQNGVSVAAHCRM